VNITARHRLGRNPKLRPLMTAWTTFYIADIAHLTLAIVFAYRMGGASAVGVATVLNVLPGGLLAPVAAALATCRRPQLHLAMGIGARCLAMVATVVAVLAGAPLGVVLALVAVDSVVSAGVRPLHGALVVRLADTAAEAAAANALACASPGVSGISNSAAAVPANSASAAARPSIPSMKL